ncbi:MAG: MmgE/PrpD family protein [Chloroflexi bacterium]|nr:MmgE/PrpD family protein [Chloroflexota bacterium]
MDASFAFARNVAGVKFEDIPADAVNIAKMSVLDTLGTTLAATTLDHGCRQIVEFVKESAGKEEATILGFGGKVPSWMAAFANGTVAHSLDYDDSHEKAQTHGGITHVPTAFAVAERAGKVNGKAFVTAVVLGMDVAFRLSLVTPKEPQDWSPTSLYGFFGAAATAGRILGLDEKQVQHALGIAYSQAAGTRQAIADSALTKRLEPGFAAMGGILSALLAQKGITGATNSLEGEFGLYKVYHSGKYDPAALTADLGKRFEVSNLSFKPYPSGRGTHSSIDATLQIVRENHLRPQDVESIRVFKSRTATETLARPVEGKLRPKNPVDAQFSIPFTVAAALVKEHVGLRDFTAQGIADPAVLEAAQKVTVQEYPEFNTARNTYLPGITEIRTRDGKLYSKRIDIPYGTALNPIPRERLVEKFTDCASYAIKPLTKKNLDSLIDMVMNLEKVDDVASIVRLLA